MKNINNHPGLKKYNQTIEKLIDERMYSEALSSSRNALEYMTNQLMSKYLKKVSADDLHEKLELLYKKNHISKTFYLNSKTIRINANRSGSHDTYSYGNKGTDKKDVLKVYELLKENEKEFLNSIPSFIADEYIEKLKRYDSVISADKTGNSYVVAFKVKLNSKYRTSAHFRGVKTSNDKQYAIYRISLSSSIIDGWINDDLKIIENNNRKSVKELDEIYLNEIKQKKRKRNITNSFLKFIKMFIPLMILLFLLYIYKDSLISLIK